MDGARKWKQHSGS